MSGHSHWAGIKHKKAANDAKRGKIWSKIARMIIVAAKAGGGDPDQNLTLRYAIEKGKAANMPKDTIEKAVKKGSGELGGNNFENVLYEGYAPGGVAIMVDALTDNRARTAPEIKKLFETRGGALGTSGCVNYLFSKKGLITINTSDVEEDKLMDIALTAGADDIVNNGDTYDVTCDPAAFEAVKKAIEAEKIKVQFAEVSMLPQTSVPVTDADLAKRILALIESFEDHDDVQNVYANFDIPDDIMAQIG